MKTSLHYLSDMSVLVCESRVLDVQDGEAGEKHVILNGSVFYPRGGGQPSDIGAITGPRGTMAVTGAHIVGGIVTHHGTVSTGELSVGDHVEVRVDAAVRRRHSRIHSAGELICAAVREAGYDWYVSSAMHYPDTAKIIFDTTLDPAQRDRLTALLAVRLHQHIAAALPVSISVTQDRSEVRRLCGYDPHYIPASDPVRIVQMGQWYARPCMGTHVTNSGEIGLISIRGVKSKKGQTSVGYDIQ